MRISKWGKRAASLLLAAVMTTLPVFQQVSYAGKKEKLTEEYLEGLFGRFEDYDNGDLRYDGLTDNLNYYGSRYAAVFYEKTHDAKFEAEEEKSFWENFKAFSDLLDRNLVAEMSGAAVWAGQNLTDTSLDEKAYVDYLSKILAMQEKGFLETAKAQAEYSVKVNIGKEILKITDKALDTALSDRNFEDFQVTVSDICGKNVIKSVEKTLNSVKDVNETLDLYQAVRNQVKTEAEAYALALYSNVHQERMAFLNAVYEYSDSKEHRKLHKAAKTMIDASNLRMAGLLLMDPAERAEDILKLVANGTGIKEIELEKFTENLMDCVSVAAEKLAGKLEGKLASGVLKGVSTLASNVTLVMAGFEIGGSIGRILWGDVYEQGRAILISNEVADVLSEAVIQYYADYRSAGKNQERYEALQAFVAAAEVLCYVRINGEYTVFQFSKGKEGSPSDEELDEMYQDVTGYVNERYVALSRIFPEPYPQIAVYMNRDREKVRIGKLAVEKSFAVPTVYIAESASISKKINQSPRISGFLEKAEGEFQSVREFALTTDPQYMNGSAGHSIVELEDVFAPAQILSMRFVTSNYYGMGAHPYTYDTCVNFDTQTGESLLFADILAEKSSKDAREKLRKLLVKELEEKKEIIAWHLGSTTAERIIEEEFVNPEDPDKRERHWYFSQDGFCVVFDEGQIGPNSGGSVTLTVPYEALDGTIKEQYLPTDLSAKRIRKDSMFQVVEKDEIVEKGSVEHEFGAKRFSIRGVRTQGMIYDAYIKRDSNIMFYANCLRPEDVVWLEDGSDGMEAYSAWWLGKE